MGRKKHQFEQVLLHGPYIDVRLAVDVIAAESLFEPHAPII